MRLRDIPGRVLAYYQIHTGKREIALVFAGYEIHLINLWVDGNANAADAARFLGTFVFALVAYAVGLHWWANEKPGGDNGGQ